MMGGHIRYRVRSGRLGDADLVQQGAGGNATSYSFDSTGLSNDPSLAPYLQNLTVPQLQTALDGKSPSADLMDQLNQELTGSGRFSLPCGQPGNPCDPAQNPPPANGVPTWAWYAGGAVAGLFVLAKAFK